MTQAPAQDRSEDRSDDVLIFANPVAGRGRGERMAKALHRRLLSMGLHSHLHLDHPDEIHADDLQPGRHARAVVAIGGDGTIRTVLRRMMDLFHDNVPPLLVAPVGTANLMCLHLGIAWDGGSMIDRMVQSVLDPQVRLVDAAIANDKPFMIVAGIGLDASIVHEVNRMRRGTISKTSYIIPAFRMLGRYTFPKMKVTVDGKVVASDLSAMIFIGNIPEYGTGFSLLPHARSDDGLLDLAVLPFESIGQGFERYLQAAAGEHLQVEGAVYMQGKHITVESTERVPVQVDGEAEGFTPLDIRLLPIKIPFLIPQPLAK